MSPQRLEGVYFVSTCLFPLLATTLGALSPGAFRHRAVDEGLAWAAIDSVTGGAALLTAVDGSGPLLGRLLAPWAAAPDPGRGGVLHELLIAVARSRASGLLRAPLHEPPPSGGGSAGPGPPSHGGTGSSGPPPAPSRGGRASRGGRGRGRGSGAGRSAPTSPPSAAPTVTAGLPAVAPPAVFPAPAPPHRPIAALSPASVDWAYPPWDASQEAPAGEVPPLARILATTCPPLRSQEAPGWLSGSKQRLCLQVLDDPACAAPPRLAHLFPRQTPVRRQRLEVLFGQQTPLKPTTLASWKDRPQVSACLAGLEYGFPLSLVRPPPTGPAQVPLGRMRSNDDKVALHLEIGGSIARTERRFLSGRGSGTTPARPILIPKKDPSQRRFLQDGSLKRHGIRTGTNAAIDYTASASVLQTDSTEVMHDAEAVRSTCREPRAWVVDL